MQVLLALCSHWLWAFTLGFFTRSLAVSLTAWLLFGGALVVHLRRHLPVRQILCIVLVQVLGGAWGYSHRLGASTSTGGKSIVLYSEFTGSSAAKLLLQSGDQRFIAVGRAFKGDVGRFRCRAGAKLFSDYDCHFVSELSHPREDPAATLASSMRHWIRRHCSHLDDDIVAWITSLILGEYSALPPQVTDAFKQTGTYHILVISGMHMTFLAMCLYGTLLGPIQVLYAFRLIKPTTWTYVWQILPMLTVILIYIYAVAVGMSSPIQRAMLAFVVRQLCKVFIESSSLHLQLLSAATLQTLIYPVGFFSESTLLSWAAYLLVIRNSINLRAGGLWLQLVASIRMQAKMCIVVAFVCGQFCWIGILVNPIANPLSNILMIASLILLLPFGHGTWVGTFAVYLIRAFIRGIEGASNLAKTIESGLFPNYSGGLVKDGWPHIVCAVITWAIILNSLSRMTIRTIGKDR